MWRIGKLNELLIESADTARDYSRLLIRVFLTFAITHDRDITISVVY